MLTPSALFREEFNVSTPTAIVQGVSTLKPTLILNAKCLSILGRPTEDKKFTDTANIRQHPAKEAARQSQTKNIAK